MPDSNAPHVNRLPGKNADNDRIRKFDRADIILPFTCRQSSDCRVQTFAFVPVTKYFKNVKVTIIWSIYCKVYVCYAVLKYSSSDDSTGVVIGHRIISPIADNVIAKSYIRHPADILQLLTPRYHSLFLALNNFETISGGASWDNF